MAPNNLKQLTEKLYQEGVEKANQEAESIIAEAKKKAEAIIQNARNEEKQIINQAEANADNLRKNVDSEVKLSGRQAISAVKQQIVNIVKGKILDSSLSAAFNDAEFIKEIILTVIKNWNPRVADPIELTVLLPREKEKELAKYFLDKGVGTLNEGVDINFDDKVKSGFKIGPKDGSYQVSFTDTDFDNFFSEYLRPRMVRLLFGSENQDA